MASKVMRKKSVKAKKKGRPSFIHLCDLMCNGMEIKDKQEGKIPIPICLAGETDEFALMCWNFWRCFISALRKELSESLTGKEMELVQSQMLFSLFCKRDPDSYLFMVHQEWVAQRLNIPARYDFLASNPTDAFKELRFLCFRSVKQNPLVSRFQKLSTLKETLSLIDKCELNLILAFLLEKSSAVVTKKK